MIDTILTLGKNDLMKKYFFLILLSFGVLALPKTLQAQAAFELGIRVPGGATGNGTNIAIDGTIPLAAKPRLQASVYLERFGFGTYFDWMFALDGGPEGLKFYPGVGPELFFEGDFDFKAAGNFGAEYSFRFPLTLGFDWRPAFRFTNDADFEAGNWGFTARFRFKSAN